MKSYLLHTNIQINKIALCPPNSARPYIGIARQMCHFFDFFFLYFNQIDSSIIDSDCLERGDVVPSADDFAQYRFKSVCK